MSEAEIAEWAEQQLSLMRPKRDDRGWVPLPEKRRLYDPDAPLTRFDKERFRGVRCEECAAVLPHRQRPVVQLDDPEAAPVYLCVRCRSGHEDRLELVACPHDGGVYRRSDDRERCKLCDKDLSGLPMEKLPPPRECSGSAVIRDERGKVVDVVMGCGRKTSEWTEGGTRTLVHAPGCGVYAATLRGLLRSTQ